MNATTLILQDVPAPEHSQIDAGMYVKIQANRNYDAFGRVVAGPGYMHGFTSAGAENTKEFRSVLMSFTQTCPDGFRIFVRSDVTCGWSEKFRCMSCGKLYPWNDSCDCSR